MTDPLLASLIGREVYASMLADPVQFVLAFDREPWPFQKNMLREVLERDSAGHFVSPVAAVSMPRQNGKTTLVTWAGLWRLFVDPTLTGDILIVALDREGARVCFGDAVSIIKNSDVLMNLVNPEWGLTRNEIRLRDGRRMLVRSAEAVRSRGLRIGCLLYDELGWAHTAELWQTLSAAMAAQANPLTLVASTVGPIQAGPLWRLFEQAEQGDPGIRLIYSTENLSPLISEEYLERQRANLPAFWYAREHMNQWGTADDVFCVQADWERAIADGDPRRPTYVGPSFCFVDIGLSHDLTAIAVVANMEDGKVDVLALETLQGSQNSPVQLDTVKQRLEELGKVLGIKRLQIESWQGEHLAQQVDIPYCRTDTLKPTVETNRQRWSSLYNALKQTTIRLPPDRKLRKELLTLTIEERASGWKVQDNPQFHNDRSVAIAGALYLAAEDTKKSKGGRGGFMVDAGYVNARMQRPNIAKKKRNRPAWMGKSPAERRATKLGQIYDDLTEKERYTIRQFAALRGMLPTQKKFGLPAAIVDELLNEVKDEKFGRGTRPARRRRF